MPLTAVKNIHHELRRLPRGDLPLVHRELVAPRGFLLEHDPHLIVRWLARRLKASCVLVAVERQQVVAVGVAVLHGRLGDAVLVFGAAPAVAPDLGQDLVVEPPALIRGYLRCGARLMGDPAWDPDFNTADLPLMLRTADLPARFRRAGA